MKKRDDDVTEVFYNCDPKKATGCSKRTCYINGGSCCLTMNPEWGRSKVKGDHAGRMGR